MRPDYKNWIPKGMMFSLIAGTAVGYIMDFGKQSFDIYIVNTGKTVHSMLELDDEIIVNRLLRG